MENNKKRRKSFSLKEKINIIKIFEEKEEENSFKRISEDLGVSPSTLRTIVNSKPKIEKEVEFNSWNLNKKHLKNSSNDFLDRSLVTWFKDVTKHTEKCLAISGNTIKEAGKQINSILKIENNDISKGFIERFVNRHDMQMYKISGEESSCNISSFTLWKNSVFQEIVKKYEGKNIFNADETAIYYRTNPSYGYFFRGSHPKGIKKHRDRCTAVICVSMMGEKLQLFIIGKSSNPRSFPKHSSENKFKYASSTNAWMTEKLFKKYLNILNLYFISKNRNVALILDQCSSHCKTLCLSNIELYFLPPNTTAISQPLDAGLIVQFDF